MVNSSELGHYFSTPVDPYFDHATFDHRNQIGSKLKGVRGFVPHTAFTIELNQLKTLTVCSANITVTTTFFLPFP